MHINRSVVKLIVTVCYYLLSYHFYMNYMSEHETNRELKSVNTINTFGTCAANSAMRMLDGSPSWRRFMQAKYPLMLAKARGKVKSSDSCSVKDSADEAGQVLIKALVHYGNKIHRSENINEIWVATHDGLEKLNEAQKTARKQQNDQTTEPRRLLSSDQCEASLLGTEIPVDIVEKLNADWNFCGILKGEEKYDIPSKSVWNGYVVQEQGMSMPFCLMHIQVLMKSLSYIAHGGGDTHFTKDFSFSVVRCNHDGSDSLIPTIKSAISEHPFSTLFITTFPYLDSSFIFAELEKTLENHGLIGFGYDLVNAQKTLAHAVAVVKNMNAPGWTLFSDDISWDLHDALTADDAIQMAQKIMREEHKNLFADFYINGIMVERINMKFVPDFRKIRATMITSEHYRISHESLFIELDDLHKQDLMLHGDTYYGERIIIKVSEATVASKVSASVYDLPGWRNKVIYKATSYIATEYDDFEAEVVVYFINTDVQLIKAA